MEKIILGIIPARGGSKGVPRKNIKILNKKPLLQYIFEAARKSEYIDRLILSTEDNEIAAIGRSMGLEIPFMRPQKLSTDIASGISVVKHALSFFDEIGYKADGIISLQATNPFLSTQTINNSVKLWLDTGCDSVTTIAETSIHPYITKRLKENNKIENFCIIPDGTKMGSRQERETAYYLTGGLYLRSRSLIEAENMDSHYLGKDSRAVVVNEMEAIDINTQIDFEFAEWMMVKKRR